MDEQNIRKIVQQELDRNYRSGSPKVPRHRHDGNDNAQVQQSTTIKNKKIVFSGALTAGSFIMKFISNPSSLLFYGYANKSNERILINGRVELGDCTTGTKINFDGTIIGTDSNFIQICNSMYSDQGNLLFGVARSAINFAYGVTNGSAVVVTGQVTSWIGNTIKGTVTLASGWALSGEFLAI